MSVLNQVFIEIETSVDDLQEWFDKMKNWEVKILSRWHTEWVGGRPIALQETVPYSCPKAGFLIA